MNSSSLTSDLDVHVSKLSILALSLAAFASGLSARITDALLPRLALEFGSSLGDTSNVITIYVVSYGVSQLFFGPLGDRFGKYLVVAWTCAACAIATLLCAVAANLNSLLVARLFAGAASGPIIALSMAWIGDAIAGERRQAVLARFMVGQILGASSGFILGGFAADYLSWQTPYLVVSFVFSSVGLIVFYVNRRLPNALRKTPSPGDREIRGPLADLVFVLRGRWARIVLLTVFLEGALGHSAISFVASHLYQTFGIPLATAGAIVMLYGVGGLFFAGISSMLLPRIGEIYMVRVGGVVACLALTLLGFSASWWWSLPGCFLVGVGLYMMHNTLQYNATQMVPERRGAAVSAFSSVFFIGQSVGLAVSGSLLESSGTTIIFAIGAAGVLLTAFIFSYQFAHR